MSRAAAVAWGIFVLSALVMIAALVLWAVGAQESLTGDIILYPLAYLASGGRGARREPSTVEPDRAARSAASASLWVRGQTQ